MRIIGPPSTTLETVHENLSVLGAAPLFINQIFPALWPAAVRYAVDPVGVVAQSYKETGAGRFPGKVRPEFCNPCGLKVRVQSILPELTGDLPLAHQIFPNWDVGARAQVQHLRAYAGWPIDTEDDLLVDPRYMYVIGKHWCESFEDLGGRWAPAVDYGVRIVEIARRLQGSN